MSKDRVVLKQIRNPGTGRGQFTVNDLYLVLHELIMDPEHGKEYGKMPIVFEGPRMTGPIQAGEVKSFGDRVRIGG